MFGCKAKVELSASNLPINVIDNLVTDGDQEKVEQEMDSAVNTLSFSSNELAAMATKSSDSPDQLSDKKNVNKFGVVSQQECSSAHSFWILGKGMARYLWNK